jgi:hypothetical protein
LPDSSSRRKGSPMAGSAQNTPQCRCLSGDVFYLNFDERALGDDSHGGDISVLRCKHCGQFWLHYLMEYPHYTGAGRWIHGPITPEMAATAEPETARRLLEGLDWYFRGGSAFNGVITKTPPGNLDLWLSIFAPASAQNDCNDAN